MTSWMMRSSRWSGRSLALHWLHSALKASAASLPLHTRAGLTRLCAAV